MKALKPDLTFFFDALPGLNSLWMKFDYENANSREELTHIAYKWLNEAENTNNEVRKHNYTVGFHFLFAFLTGKSYDSKIDLNNFSSKGLQ